MMTSGMRLRLGAMMFLQYFVWGAWFVTLGTFLATSLQSNGAQIALAFATQSWGAILAPLIVGLMADRYFNAERMLGLLHLAGSALLYGMYTADRFETIYPIVFTYMLLYMPTLALSNSVVLRQLQDPSRQFANIRVWGTGGWIAAGLAISLIFSWDSVAGVAQGQLRNTFVLASVASLLLGLFSFTLPATPPTDTGQSRTVSDLLGLGALRLLKDRNFLTFFVSSVLICIPLAFYYQHANQFLVEIGVENATGKQTLGQVSEVLFMLLIPIFLRRFGMKLTLVIGMAAWSLRYLLFAFGEPSGAATMLLIGIALHGICYDFFFVSGQIYTDSKAGAANRSAAQGLITLATYGVGMLAGFWAAGQITDLHASAAQLHDWRAIWLYPAAFATLVAVAFMVLFKNERINYDASLRARGTAAPDVEGDSPAPTRTAIHRTSPSSGELR
jgi:nucleoside transporter